MEMADLPLFIIRELSGPYGPVETDRINEIHKYYSIYGEGADFETEYEDTDEFTPTNLKSKKIKRLISKQAEFMVGKPPDIKITCPDEEKTDQGKPNESAMQEYIKCVLKKNIWSDKLLKGAKDCFIGGKVALKVNVSADKLSIMFVPADGFVYETEYDDVDILKKVVLFYCINNTEDKNDQKWWRQRYRMENGKCLVTESLHDGYGELIPGSVSKDDADTGLDRIPVYVIVNDGLSGDTCGESDVNTIMDEDSWYNKMRSANLDTVRKTMNQITWIAGASPKAFEKLSTAPGSVWDLQADVALGNVPNVGTIENKFSYKDAYSDTLGIISENMHDSLGIPDLSLEKTQGLMTSGKGLKMLYWPLICRCEAKWAAWKPAFEWMAELLLYAAEKFPALKSVYGDFKNAEHVITIDNQYPLPEDEAEERKLDLQEVGVARSIKSYLMEWGGPDHKGMTDDDADSEIQQMIFEKRAFEDSYEGDLTGGDE